MEYPLKIWINPRPRPSHCRLGSAAAAVQPLATDLGWALHAAPRARWGAHPIGVENHQVNLWDPMENAW